MQITTQETTTILNANSQFLAYTDGKNIYQLQPLGMGQNQKVIVGVTQQTYDELKELTDHYYNKLVELGIIKPPKTAEEMAAEQQQAMQDMLAIIKDLKTEVEELKNAKRTSDIKPTERQSSNAK
jgi:hypothetical protein